MVSFFQGRTSQEKHSFWKERHAYLDSKLTVTSNPGFLSFCWESAWSREKNPGWRRAPEDLGFGSGFATCLFYDLNKSFKRSGLWPFPEVKGSGPAIKESPFSSGVLCFDRVYHTEDTGDPLLGTPLARQILV